MFKNCPKGLTVGLLAITALALTGGATYLSLTSSEYLASLFGDVTKIQTDNSAANTVPSTPSKETSSILQFDNDNTFAEYSLYGIQKPATEEELCNFLDGRLHDVKILAPRALHRYTTDFNLHCKDNQDLKGAAPEIQIDWSKFPPNLQVQSGNKSMKSFLRNASSGGESMKGLNSIFLLFGSLSDSTYTP